MRRSEVWLVELDPAVGSEANKTRPCVIVSNDSRNIVAARGGRSVVTIVPFTSAERPPRPFQARIPAEHGNGLAVDSIAQAEQIRSVDVARMVSRLGDLRTEHMAAIDAAIMLHLDL